jgi:hypothetical protein
VRKLIGDGEMPDGIAESGFTGTGHSAGFALETSQAGFAAASAAASRLSNALTKSGARYARAETFAAAVAQAGQRFAAGILGLATPMLLLGGAATAIRLSPIAGAGMLAALFTPEEHRAAIGRIIHERGLAMLSHPAFVGLVRAAADTTDEFLAGLFHSPELFAVGGALKAPENATLLLGAAGIVGVVTGSRALRESGVSVTEVTDRAADRDAPSRSVEVPPARGVGDLAARIPPSEAGQPQIRIERYDTAEGARWIVYSGGTVDFGTTPSGEPYDMTANLHGVAGSSSLGELLRIPADAAA